MKIKGHIRQEGELAVDLPSLASNIIILDSGLEDHPISRSDK